jgi:hypothetical protein
VTKAPRFRVTSVELYERAVRLRLPFRFGAATLTGCPQAFVRARIELGDGRRASGAAAEMMVPKWFDKSPEKSNAENIDDLRGALVRTADAYTSAGTPRTAFGHFAAHYHELMELAAAQGINALTANFGPAVLDRALLDALCHALDVSFFAAMRGNAAGIGTGLTPDLEGVDIDRFLATRTPHTSIAARHTVGIVDPLTVGDAPAQVADGLPQTLAEIIAHYGNTYFKLKLGGNPDTDIARLVRIAATLDQLPRYAVTLDGNEQYADVNALARFWEGFGAARELTRLAASTLYCEQPLSRARALDAELPAVARVKPLLIDESDSTLDAFPAARAGGYAGVSSKSCKGVYKALLNAARVAHWNAEEGRAHYFVSGEDLTMQAGLALQQDLALVCLLGLGHVERNGHHYVDGFAGGGADATEQQRFLAAHPTLYASGHGGVRLALLGGVIDLTSLDATGFASGAEPEWSALSPLALPDAGHARVTR